MLNKVQPQRLIHCFTTLMTRQEIPWKLAKNFIAFTGNSSSYDYPSNQKNRDADAMNPNLANAHNMYSSGDIDHVYDEIDSHKLNNSK